LIRRLALLAALLAPLAAHAFTLDAPVEQGRLIRGQTSPKATILLDGKKLPVSPEGKFVFGLARDATGTITLTENDTASVLPIAPRAWDIQRIEGLPPGKVNPDPEGLKRIQREAALIKAARSQVTDLGGFVEAFRWPANGRISGIYGSQRILNGEPRAPHLGLDIAGPTGTVIRAPASGRVVLAEPDLFFTGRTVMIDHGHGVGSIFAHLSASSVTVGQVITAGQEIGAVGATGRVTGPHLHWGVYWGAVTLDPLPLMPTPVPPPLP
jgi:murein DD-endopeptidase MepM/ murein hydrolase activator NlpD